MESQQSSRTQVVFLGTGNPNPDPQHLGPSTAIIVDQTPYIIDFGVGLVRNAAALTPQYGGLFAALEAQNLKTGFLTHLHSDHTIGLPDLILTPWILERDEPLRLFGPHGTKNLSEHILKAYHADIQYRLNGLEPINEYGYQVVVSEYSEGMIFQDGNIKVEAFLVSHGRLPNTFGFRFTTPDKSIVISGDTSPCENILNFGKGVDILIHEVYSFKGFCAKDTKWQYYHSTHHTSTIQVGEIARKTKPKLLVLYHTLFWGATETEILAEVKSVYDGEIILSSDLLVLP